jgi:hypothetical protein
VVVSPCVVESHVKLFLHLYSIFMGNREPPKQFLPRYLTHPQPSKTNLSEKPRYTTYQPALASPPDLFFRTSSDIQKQTNGNSSSHTTDQTKPPESSSHASSRQHSESKSETTTRDPPPGFTLKISDENPHS